MRHLSLAFGLSLLIVPSAASTAKIHCGTMLWMEKHAGEPRGPAMAKRTALGPQARVLETDHFVLHYSLRGLHRIKTTEADQELVRVSDSLFASLPPSLTGNRADSAVYAKLDSLGAPHPVYADTMAKFFEQARAYYVDHLGMRAPRSTVPSHFYSIPVGAGDKYAVDIVDIGYAEPSFQNYEIYALTFPASEGGMLMDNDFLFATHLGQSGIPEGDSISSIYQGKVLHNYVIDWPAGLKVTCFHEFYHGVQFTYVPILGDRHVWYETGAVGMEERNAPEVNDYLQYLPDLFADLPNMSMFDYPNRLSEYGNGIFHLFLTRELAEDFDVKVWSRLAENGNRLTEALATMFASYGRTSRDVYARYAAQLAFAGTAYKAPFPLFDEDIPIWPRLTLEDLDLQSSTAFSTGLVYNFSLRAIHVTGAKNSGKVLVLQDSLLAPVNARLGTDSSRVDFAQGAVPLDMPDETGRENILLVPNGSMERTGRASISLAISKTDAEVRAYPNPAPRNGFSILYFTHPPRAASVRIFGEDGLPIRSLSFPEDQKLWSWDMAAEGGAAVKPGVYYYQADGGPLQALYLAPGQ